MSKTADHKARLKALAQGGAYDAPEPHAENLIPEDRISEIRPSDIQAAAVNPEHGQRGGFRKATITMHPDTFEAVHGEVHRRKLAGEPNALLSAVLREAVAFWQAQGMPKQE